MRSYEELLRIADELEHIGLSGDKSRNEYLGLCTSLGISSLVRVYAQSWEFFSGCFMYPVPAPNHTDAESARRRYDERVDMYTGEYGESRKDLALHIANCIREDYDLDVPFTSSLLKAAAELDRLARGGPPKTLTHGLCVDYITGVVKQGQKFDMFNSWPEYSGVQPFPVPHPTSSALVAYSSYPLYEGAYGESRRRLAGHLSNCLRELYYAERLAKACGEHTAGS
jgi:hypothetical protein